MVLNIKNMVCSRCIMAVEGVFATLGFKNYKVSMGQVELSERELLPVKKHHIISKLGELGFEIIDDKYGRIIENIKNLVIEYIQSGDLSDRPPIWSELISSKIPYDYKYISRLFSSVEGITVEHFIIQQKIERVKELIVYDELSLSEVAWKLGYSSVAHVSGQFKKVTGMSPRDFKEIGAGGRKALDKV